MPIPTYLALNSAFASQIARLRLFFSANFPDSYAAACFELKSVESHQIGVFRMLYQQSYRATAVVLILLKLVKCVSVTTIGRAIKIHK